MKDLAFHHAALSVPDLGQAADWYYRAFGFVEEFRFNVPNAQVVMLKSGDLRLELFCAEHARPLPEGRSDPSADIATHGNKHVAFCVPDIEAALDSLAAKGIEPAARSKDGPQNIAFLRDVCGNLVELVEAY